MEKRTWTENGWDYSNRQKKLIRAEQLKKQAAGAKRKKNDQKKMAELLEPIAEDDIEFEKSAVLVEVSDIQKKDVLKTWWWW